jgi:hypothetical protein
MFTNILRRRGPAVLAAGAAAAAVLARAVPAGGSTGARQTSPEQAGYTANHAQFKEIDGNIYLRDPRPYAGMVARYGHNIQLWSADRVVSLNLHRQAPQASITIPRSPSTTHHPPGDRLGSER